MRTSEFLLATLRETPAEAETVSNKLMLRAGMIRKVAAGVFTWLPMGLRVLRKVENIIREEMNKTGALEILMPAIQPAELWQESGRWDFYGSELLRIKDRHERDFCFGPTHEEVVTDLFRSVVRSYKQLPINLYQIQVKFRDEIRPRFGVMRGREFIMKDAYSFHLDQESLNKTYQIMYQAYSNIFQRMDLKFRAVLADTGNIGGNTSHEFQVLADSGEDLIAYSDQSNYTANIEKAETLIKPYVLVTSNKSMQEVATPSQRSVEEVSNFLQVPPQKILKTLIVKGKDVPWVALVLRGDHDLNELRTSQLPQIFSPLTFANPEEIPEIIGTEFGFIGPVGLTIPIIADYDALHLTDFVCGANKKGAHLINVNWERDVKVPETAALRKVQAGDPSPDGKGVLQLARGIEVGQIFQLGDKYSKAMRATVLNEAGKAITVLMGCYGIGVTRTVAAVIEQSHDDHGIIWPNAIAPFQIALIPMSMHKSYRVKEAAEKIYAELENAGFEVLFDDRKERAGVLFADMDMLGIPHRIVISETGLDNGMVEYKHRGTSATENISITNIIGAVKNKLMRTD